MKTRSQSQKPSPTTEMAPEEDRSGVLSRGGRRRKTDSYWFKKRMEALSQHFNPIALPPPGKRLDIGAHESLLKRLGLWKFVNLGFDESIREDLVKEVVLCYKRKQKGREQVNGSRIRINRTALANALRLPLKKDAKGAFLVSEEEASFIEELVWSFMVLKDEGDEASLMSHSYMRGFAEVLREKVFDSADWAGLVWFMVEREVLRGQNLANCHYASHLQLLLKHQRPDWFGGDDVHGGVGAGSEGGQSILTKCGKRKRGFLDGDEGERWRKLDMAGRELFLDDDEDDDERKRLRKLHMAGQELGGDDQDFHQPEFEFKYAAEKSRDSIADVAGREEQFVTDVGFLVTQEAHDEVAKKDSSTDGLDRQEIENQQNKVDIIENQYKPEAEFKSATELYKDSIADVAGDEMDCQEVDFTCLEEYAGREVESMTFADLVMAQEAHEDGMKNEGSTDGLVTRKFNEHWIQQKKLDIIDENWALQNVANDAVCKTSTGMALQVPCMKDDDALPDDTGNENALKVHCSNVDYVVPDEPSEAHFDGSFIVPCKARDEFLEDKENETAFEANAGNSLKVHCKNEDGVMGDEAKAVCEANIIISHEVHSEKDDDLNEEVENEAEFEANIGKSVNVHCEKKYYELPRKEQEAAFEANDGNSLGVCGLKEDMMEHKEYEANISDSLTEEVNTVQDCHQPEVEFKNEAVKNREAEFSGDEMKCQEVYTGKQVVHEPYDLEMDCSGAELTLMQSNKEGDATGTLVNQAHEGKVSDKEQMLHKVQLVPIDVSSESSDDEKCQNAFGYLERGEGSGMNGQFQFETDTPWCSFGMADQYGHGEDIDNMIGIGTSNEHVEQFQFETDTPWCSFGMTAQYGHEEDINNRIGIGTSNEHVEKGQNAFGHLERGEGSGMNGQFPFETDTPWCSFGMIAQNGHGEDTDNRIGIGTSNEHVEKCQNALGHLERGEGSGMNGQFPFETDTPWCSFGMTAQNGHGEDTDNRIGIGTSNEHVEKSMDLDHCAENVNVWVERLTDSAKEKVEESDNSNLMLQKKVEEQNELIQKYELMLQKERQDNWQYERTLHKEQQEKQTRDHRYERELYLLNTVLQEHRTSLKQVNTAFANYRERSQLPEGYMAHPDGGGRVVLVSEWEQEQQNKSRLAIEAVMEKFEEQWKSNLEEQLGILGVYSDRLEDLEHAVKTMKL